MRMLRERDSILDDVVSGLLMILKHTPFSEKFTNFREFRDSEKTTCFSSLIT